MDRNEEEKISLVETRKPTKNGVEGKHSKVGKMLGRKPPKNKKALEIKGSLVLLAETKGFEPLIQVLPGCSLSRGVPSTSRPRLRQKSADNIVSKSFGQT